MLLLGQGSLRETTRVTLAFLGGLPASHTQKVTSNCAPTAAMVSMPQPLSPLVLKKCLRSSCREQPLLMQLSGGHTTTWLLKSSATGSLGLPLPSGSLATAPSSQGASADGC